MLVRVQHGVEVCLKKRCAKEFAAALELSGNEKLLLEILICAESTSKVISPALIILSNFLNRFYHPSINSCVCVPAEH